MRINMGCGLRPTPGWRNFDNSLTVRLSHVPGFTWALSILRRSDEHAKLMALCRSGTVEYATAQRIPAQTGTADVIYSSHMLEHLHPRDARLFLAEVKRVLRPGGIIRLALPDLEMIVRAYIAHGDADTMVESTLLATPVCSGVLGKLRFLVVGNRHHLWMYDGRSLCRLLAACGFSEATVMSAGSTRIPYASPLDLNERADQSVYVEATPSSP
jgi:SAM-dependent methyltransferase